MHDHNHDDPVQDRQDDLISNPGGGDCLETRGNGRIEGLGHLLGHGPENLHGTQGGDKGRQLAVGNQRAVQAAHQHAHEDCRENGNYIGKGAGDAHGGQRAVGLIEHIEQPRTDGAEGGAYRKIDAAGNDGKAHAQGDYARVGVVPENVQPGDPHFAEHARKGACIEALHRGLNQDHHQQGKQGGQEAVLRPDFPDAADGSLACFVVHGLHCPLFLGLIATGGKIHNVLFVHILSGYMTYDPAMVHHKTAVADADDLLSLGAENDDCHALLGQAMDDTVDLFLGAYVNALAGIVQD